MLARCKSECSYLGDVGWSPDGRTIGWLHSGSRKGQEFAQLEFFNRGTETVTRVDLPTGYHLSSGPTWMNEDELLVRAWKHPHGKMNIWTIDPTGRTINAFDFCGSDSCDPISEFAIGASNVAVAYQVNEPDLHVGPIGETSLMIACNKVGCPQDPAWDRSGRRLSFTMGIWGIGPIDVLEVDTQRIARVTQGHFDADPDLY